MTKPLCIIGAGYLGLVSAIGLAELGCDVVAYDVDEERIAALAGGTARPSEARVGDSLRKHITRGRVRFTRDHADAVRGAGMILISVGTPAREDRSADLDDVWNAVRALDGCDLSACDAVVIRSTVPPGTSDEIAAFFGDRVPVVYAPEFLREGTALADFLAPDRIVVGGDHLDAQVGYAQLFEPLEVPVMLTTRRNAELIKSAANAFLAMKITFANEVANLCGALGADADDVLRGVGYDRRIGSAYLAPGIGFGGSCFERDLTSLKRTAEEHDVPLQLAAATLQANSAQPQRIVRLVTDELGHLNGRTIAVWGLAFKAGTDGVRDSLALRIVADLVARGATVTAFDPAAGSAVLPDGATLAPTALAALTNADALLVLTEWPEFARISPMAIARALAGNSVVDGRNVLDAERISSAGLRYRGLGRFAEAGRTALPVAI